jgi:hypothetical protein
MIAHFITQVEFPEIGTTAKGSDDIPVASGRGSCGERPKARGPRDRAYRGDLVRENPWLQLHLRRILLNVRYALIATNFRFAAKGRDGPKTGLSPPVISVLSLVKEAKRVPHLMP